MGFGRETPGVLLLAAPCKGFSGRLASIHAATDKYQALNGLTLRGIWLTLEAYKDSPIPIILFENVPRIRRSDEHTSELQSLMRISYAVFCLKKKTINITPHDSS